MPVIVPAQLEGSHDLYVAMQAGVETLIATETLELRPIHPGLLQSVVLAVDFSQRPARWWQGDFSTVWGAGAVQVTPGVRAQPGETPVWYLDVNWAW
ncbi:MAG TPA: hypothetical protein VFK80_04725 [Limnochordia bacterium]|nr:hypothetical protein [Limnochordia bacterium]